MNNPDIFSYIKQQESEYETQEVEVGENWSWNMRHHVQLIFHLVNGVFFTGENNWLRAFKQVMRPLLRLSFWTEDLEVKDAVFFIEGRDDRALSFLVKKYHDEVYTREHDLDTMFDEITENDITYGGVLLQKGQERPEVLSLNSIAFCDQTNILGGPLGFKMFYSPDKLKDMSKFGWGEEKNGATISLEELCTLAREERDAVGTLNEKKNQVTGKTIEVYVIRGNLPKHYLLDNDDFEYHCNQLQIVAFYTDKKNKKHGVTLYRKKEEEGNLMFHSSEKIYGRALGYSDGEALLPHQIWTNFLTIHKMGLLEAGSKVPLYTDDATYIQKNKIQDMENLEVTTIEDGKRIYQVPTAAPANIQLFESSINEFYESAQLNSSAFDSVLGKEESAGTTFRGQERLVAQGRGWHDRRRGQRAKFIELIYRKFIIPDIVKEITKGKKFLATLSIDELTWVTDQLATKYANEKIKRMILDGKLVTKEEQDLITQTFKQNYAKGGNKKLLEIIKGELEGVELRMGINIAGKQKNLASLSDKLLSIVEAAMNNPQFRQNLEANGMMGAFNDILEYSGISPASFATMVNQPIPSPIQPASQSAPQPSPLALSQTNE